MRGSKGRVVWVLLIALMVAAAVLPVVVVIAQVDCSGDQVITRGVVSYTGPVADPTDYFPSWELDDPSWGDVNGCVPSVTAGDLFTLTYSKPNNEFRRGQWSWYQVNTLRGRGLEFVSAQDAPSYVKFPTAFVYVTGEEDKVKVGVRAKEPEVKSLQGRVMNRVAFFHDEGDFGTGEHIMPVIVTSRKSVTTTTTAPPPTTTTTLVSSGEVQVAHGETTDSQGRISVTQGDSFELTVTHTAHNWTWIKFASNPDDRLSFKGNLTPGGFAAVCGTRGEEGGETGCDLAADVTVTADTVGKANVVISYKSTDTTVPVIVAAKPPPPPPVMSITAMDNGSVTEGAPARFCISPDRQLDRNIRVKVSVSREGSFFGVNYVNRQVTVGTATGTGCSTDIWSTRSTNADGVNEPNGSITFTLEDGNGYTVSPTAGAATVNVLDDDNPSLVIEGFPDEIQKGQTVSFKMKLDDDPYEQTINIGWETRGGLAQYSTVRPRLAFPDSQARFTYFGRKFPPDDVPGKIPAHAWNFAAGLSHRFDTSNWDTWRTVRVYRYKEAADGNWDITLSHNAHGTSPLTKTVDLVTPEVSVEAGCARFAVKPVETEGRFAGFSIKVVPAPSNTERIAVGYSLSESGRFLSIPPTNSRTVTVRNGRTCINTLTDDDKVDEPDGTVTLTINPGDGYVVSSTAGSATVTIKDNDESDSPPPPPPPRHPALPAGSPVSQELLVAAQAQTKIDDPTGLHVITWKRVLWAFGAFDPSIDTTPHPIPTKTLKKMTVSEAKEHRRRSTGDLAKLWRSVVTALEKIEEKTSKNQTPGSGEQTVDRQSLITDFNDALTAETRDDKQRYLKWALDALNHQEYPANETVTWADPDKPSEALWFAGILARTQPESYWDDLAQCLKTNC